ncbi:Acetyltransferase, GNAT family [uncultured Eubacteriales bacterium]|uniref:Acetyltransferase, GNAT family n=1 Tax=uncultured Eubacteriales bacterium TaxID=172733 RepID=A0A212KCJ4_9FIRM|nr:Acetyltransferase, GNAT family [uncultured Eubacteriales bacterium]
MPKIRPAKAGDLDEIWALVGRAVVHMNALGNPQWGSDYPTRQHYADDIAQGELYAVVDGAGAILGVACLNTDQAPEYASLLWRVPGPAIAVHRMAVDPAAQRQGVASTLFAFAEELARARGIPAVHADTYEKNDRMQALFLGRGYEKMGEVYFERPSRPLGYPCFEKLFL